MHSVKTPARQEKGRLNAAVAKWDSHPLGSPYFENDAAAFAGACASHVDWAAHTAN
eukprot:CAMPEP_0203962386 /NCGR_PEP_ID=MMETSP0359-20131031/92597_1 /ASSEMBLY_ACC=CAM_ASM_000338 /TAXON_ID=268821 /ORGANISM="Scrippsiella Hangoei, Strain SHTV-5" /LENGTH=55 /DNA_ID=CAMNT_0050897693 /DNA_START=74 /DNA_END=239 /DNA_ORIENTATION=+